MERRSLFHPALTAADPGYGERVLSASHDQPSRIGVLLPVPGNEHFLMLLRDGLSELGRREESGLTIEVREGDGTVEGFLRLGHELNALGVDVMVTASTAAASALARVTTTIPIVFVGVFDPVSAGLVETLDRPGWNLTGIAGFRADIAGEWVSLLQEIAPVVKRLVLFYNPASMPSAALAGYVSAAASRAPVGEVCIESVGCIDRSVAGVAVDPHAGMIVLPHTFPFANWQLVVEAMARHRVPAIYGISEMVRSGGLISYGQDLSAQWRMSAGYVDRVLAGARPADLPVRYASRYSLTLNRGAAAALGLSLPKILIDRADEIVGSGGKPEPILHDR